MKLQYLIYLSYLEDPTAVPVVAAVVRDDAGTCSHARGGSDPTQLLRRVAVVAPRAVVYVQVSRIIARMKRRRVEDEKDAPPGASGNEDAADFCRIEPAKSGRARCRVCGEKIAKGALRAGKEIDLGEHLGGRLGVAWYHIRCTVLRSGGADVEAVSGFGDLSAAQQEVARSGGERTESVDAGMATGSVDASRATGIPPCPAIGTAATTVNSAVAASACKFLLGGATQHYTPPHARGGVRAWQRCGAGPG